MKTPTLPTLWRGRIPSALTLLASGVLLANAAVAQDSASGDIEEVVITGSYIKGTGTDEASPVEVLNNDYIQKSGAITVAELTQKLAVSTGAETNPDSFTSGELQGTTNVNLRGLGLTSTLVLVNGKRQTLAAAVANDGSVFVDTSTVPMAALERVEILKEGATATYGSDAVAGVVNFILRDEFEGFEMSAGYQTTATSSQDTFDVSMLGGWESGGTNYVVAASFQQQDPLSSAERDYTTINAASTLGRSFLSLAPGNVGTGAYAGTYNLLETIPDANCEANGGVPGGGFVPAGAFDAVYGIPTGGGAKCGFLYGPRFNLVNDEERTNLYASMKRDMSNGVSMKAELGFVKNEVFDNPQSPSYPNLAFPTILPGQAGSPFSGPVRWYGRPLGSEAPSPVAPRNSETIRASIDFAGSFSNDWDWNASLTYSENDREGYQPDTYKSRLEDALAGNGGASGTETFNIFDPSQNSAELIDYISATTYTNRVTELLVGDLVVSGAWIEMPGGTSSVAYGAQWRSEGYKVDRNEVYTQTPDPATGELQDVDLIFLGGGAPVDVSRDAVAVFAEANLPMSESIELSVAGRYEALDTDNSLDSKISLRWQMADNLVFRASGSTAFREPSLVQLNNVGTSLQGLVDPLSGSSSALFVRVRAEGNTNLKPEQSTNTNLGLVWSPSDNLDMRVDYWKFYY